MPLTLRQRRRRAINMLMAGYALAQEATGGVSHVDSAVANSTTNSTGLTITIPGTVQAGDVLLMLLVNDGANTDPNVGDNDAGGNAWAVISGTGLGISLWYKRATSSTGGKTVTVTGMTTGCSGGLAAYRNCVVTEPPYENLATEALPAGTETATGVTPTADRSMICFFVGNRAAGAVETSGYACTNPGALTERFKHLNSTGGCAVAHASAPQGSAAATGNITWAQTNGATRVFVLDLLRA